MKDYQLHRSVHSGVSDRSRDEGTNDLSLSLSLTHLVPPAAQSCALSGGSPGTAPHVPTRGRKATHVTGTSIISYHARLRSDFVVTT